MAAPKGKKPSKSMKIWTLYQVSGKDVTRKSKNCPKCGPGHFLAVHENRVTCGLCHYTEFTAKEKKK